MADEALGFMHNGNEGIGGGGMQLLLNLYLGHLLGDFVFQPGSLVSAKRNGVAGLLLHAGIVGACTAIILYSQFDELWNVVLLAIAAHLAIEVITIRARVLSGLSGLSVFLIDQAMHLLSLVVLVWIASPIVDVEQVQTLGMDLPPSWVALADAFITVTFMGSIIVFEANNSFGPQSMRRQILPWDANRIIGMVERGTALLLATLLPALLGNTSPAIPIAALVAPFVPRTLLALRLTGDSRAYQQLVAATGLVVCSVGWLLVAVVTFAASS